MEIMRSSSNVTIDQALQTAVQHHQQNRLAEAEAMYRHILTAQPGHPIALHLLGRLLGQRGQLAEAVELLKQSISVHPGVAEAHILLGEFLRLSGRLDEAIDELLRATNFRPAHADAFNSLGNALRERGRVEEAAAAFRQAIAAKPDYAEPHSNLGNALRALGRFEESIAAHQNAVRLKPQSAEIHNNFGISLKDKGDVAGSIVEFSRALEFKPDFVDALNNLGGALVVRGRMDEALAAFSRAAALRPNSADVQNNLGNVLKEKGRLDESATAYSRALQLRPDFAEAHSNLGINLSSQGRLDEAIESFRRAMQAKPEAHQYFGNYLYTIHFHPAYDAGTILREHQEWARQYSDPLANQFVPHTNDRTADRKLRIGYVSPDFREHPVGRFLAPLLAAHDRERFEIVCYCGVRIPDELTGRMKSCADQWHETAGMSDEALAEQIRRDRIDVLVDLTLHMTGSRLLMFARKPAPVQVTWLGYVGTTGVKAIDYRISDAYLDPVGLQEQYVERTVRLPQCYWCYEPPRGSPEVNSLPALSAGHVTFGCFNNFMKVTPPTLDLWAQILANVHGSRILIHSHAGLHQNHVRQWFAERGVEPSRVEFIPMMPTPQYMQAHQQIDIALDPFPYGGGTTTCDALWMGVPVVSLAGQTAVGRAGISLLNNISLPELSAQTPQQYVSITTDLAQNLKGLSEMREGLREMMRESPLMDARRFARDMEAAYRTMWEIWAQAAANH
jgi:predicted O-linked N-acetylglucosamine transferase (SPINDLY family)